MSSSANGTLTSPILPPAAPPMPTHVNGFPVIAGIKINPRGVAYRHQWIVMVDRGRDAFQRYVVWTAYWHDDRKDSEGQPMPPYIYTEAGYYTDSPTSALADFVDRFGQRGLVTD